MSDQLVIRIWVKTSSLALYTKFFKPKMALMIHFFGNGFIRIYSVGWLSMFRKEGLDSISFMKN